MSKSSCSTCASYRAEIARLKVQIQKMQRTIDTLKWILNKVRAYAANKVNSSRPIVSAKSGIPKGTMAYHKGCYEVAWRVIELLKGG